MHFSLGKTLGVIAGLLPLLYIGFMLRHFVGVGGGSIDGIVGIGLGPTVIGLSIVGLLFALPLIVKLLRAATGVNRVPGKGIDTKLKPGEVSDEPSFDADAVFANYMRKRDQAADVPPAEPAAAALADDAGFASPRPSGFGRKGLG